MEAMAHSAGKHFGAFTRIHENWPLASDLDEFA
jgi:hypothetical protein